MDEDLSQLEAELSRLRPAPLAPEFTVRIAQAIKAGPGERQDSFVRAGWWIALPVAAAASVLLFHFAESRLPPSEADSLAARSDVMDAPYKPVAAENLLVSARDEGLVTLEDGTPARRRRLHFVDTITWRDPRTNASVIWSVPREEVRVFPVVFH